MGMVWGALSNHAAMRAIFPMEKERPTSEAGNIMIQSDPKLLLAYIFEIVHYQTGSQQQLKTKQLLHLVQNSCCLYDNQFFLLFADVKELFETCGKLHPRPYLRHITWVYVLQIP